MRSTNSLATSQAGLGITRLHAQNDNKPFDCWFDYLRLTFPIDDKQTVMDIVDWLMGKLNDTGSWTDEPKFRDHYHWDNEFVAVGGARIQYRLPIDGKPGQMAITFPGDVIETVERHKLLWTWFVLWRDYGARATRLDTKLDDFKRQLSLDWIEEKLESPYIYRFRTSGLIKRWRCGKPIVQGYEFGSRESEVYIRIYDKFLESKGKEDWIRLELELKGLTAQHYFDEVMRLYDSNKQSREVGQCLSALMAKEMFSDRFGLLFREIRVDEEGNIDSRNRARNAILPYWQEFMDKVLKFFVGSNFEMSHEVPRPKPALERCINFLQRSVANAYSAVREAYGKEYAESLVSKGFEQLSRTHKAMVNKTLMEMQYAMDKTIQTTQQIQQMFSDDWDSNYDSNTVT